MSDRKLQIVEGRIQRSHVVEKAAGLVSTTKTGSIPQAPPNREGEHQGCSGDFKKQLCQKKSQNGRLSQQLTGSKFGQSRCNHDEVELSSALW